MKLGYILGMGGLGKPSNPLLRGLEHYWTLDELSGTRYDSVGSAHLSDNNTVGRVLGVNGTRTAATKLAISSSLYQTDGMDFGDTDFSFAGWVRWEGDGGNAVWLSRDSSSKRSYAFDQSGGWRWYINGGATGLVSIASVTTAMWHFAVLYHDSVNNKLGISIDGGAFTPANTTGAPPSGTGANFRLFARDYLGANGYSTSQMQGWGAWSRVLTTDDVASLYNSGAGKLYSGLSAADKVGLVSFWNLDETSGTRNDSHGTNHLSDNNSVGYVDVKDVNAASFVPLNAEHLDSTAGAVLPTGDGSPFTLSAWVYLLGFTGNDYLFYSVASNKGIALQLTATNGSWLVYDGVAGRSVPFGAPLSTGAWHHLALWYDDTTDKHSVSIDNGTPITYSSTVVWKAPLAATAFRIGWPAGGSYSINGYADEIGVWSRVLTANERTTLYNAGAGKFYPAF